MRLRRKNGIKYLEFKQRAKYKLRLQKEKDVQ